MRYEIYELKTSPYADEYLFKKIGRSLLFVSWLISAEEKICLVGLFLVYWHIEAKTKLSLTAAFYQYSR